jgi:hypothetical protein
VDLRFTQFDAFCVICGGTYAAFAPAEATQVGQVVSFQSPTNGAIPLYIEFVVWGTDCGVSGSTVVMNDKPQAILPPFPITANSCNCNRDCQSKTSTGNVLDFFPSGTNTITMNANGVDGTEAVAFIQVCIEYCG